MSPYREGDPQPTLNPQRKPTLVEMARAWQSLDDLAIQGEAKKKYLDT